MNKLHLWEEKHEDNRPVQSHHKGILGLLITFQVLALALAFLFHIQDLSVDSLFFAGGLILTSSISIIIIQKVSTGDPYPLMIVNMIFSIGIIMIYRIRPDLGVKQMVTYLMALIAYFSVYFILKVGQRFWEGKIIFYYGVTLLLFVLTLVLGEFLHGAKNWITIGGIQVQPSEFAKIPFAFFVASWFKRYDEFQTSLLRKLSLTLATFLLIGLFFLQKELGTAVVFFAVLLVAQLAYEKNSWIPFMNLVLAVAGLYVAYRIFPYIQDRFAIWRDPWADYNNKGYQVIQAAFALAAGSFFGTGVGLGQPGRVPLGHSDFIFASVVEEFGSMMGICLILLFVILLYRGFKTAMNQERDFYSALALCVVVIFAAQAFIMFAGTMKLIPLTGITIPFLTYGGSSLVSSFALLAALQVASEDLMGMEASYEAV
ncbi:FtsW/RodA/SpoVE family cell cycle protein [Kallipyga massiliensis]|uniref:FtsW/RodA/SpoVE family cell cycle protein n=1 Tax=Kallipyga massiliensis TaxID=1472764 RepID=UPI0004B7E3CF|nr:FtsW/RodA/SpoVE family cell cycle protein [Kallipyga massiliensis]